MTLADDFRTLIEAKAVEQDYQQFLEQHTEFIPREFVQNHGIHFQLLLRKLSFGRDFTTDFFYLSKSSDDWNCVFIEIEKPQSHFFRDGASNPNACHPEFVQALEQINTWRAWLQSHANAQFFEDHTVGLIRRPLTENPCSHKFVLVHGRRSEYAGNQDRRALIHQQERDDFKIITYDSLLEHQHMGDLLYVAARTNVGLNILSDSFIDESLFVYVHPSQIEVSAALHASASNTANWFVRTGPDLRFAMESIAPQLRVRSA